MPVEPVGEEVEPIELAPQEPEPDEPEPKEPEPEEAAPAEPEWISLFNGKDLDGWQVKFKGQELGVNYKDTFRVKDGALSVDYSNWDGFAGEFGHIFFDGDFSNYRIRLEYRFTGDQVSGGPGWAFRNNGVMVHGQRPDTMLRDQEFPVSIEVQLLGGGGSGERSTGNLCTPGTNVVMDEKLQLRHCINSNSKTFHGDQWVKAEVEVRGSESIRHFINGELVMTYHQPQLDERDQEALPFIIDGEKLLTHGTISLQAESHPCEFRNIEILVLDE